MQKIYRGFPRRLNHDVPSWVEDGAVFHIRVAIDREKNQLSLSSPAVAPAILDSVPLYEKQFHWYVTIFVLMPDHLHALVSFPKDKGMSVVVGNWKRFHSRQHGVIWQKGYFDHRLRDDERGEQFAAKIDYIRRNPVVAGLCVRPQDWPWVYPVDRALRARC